MTKNLIGIGVLSVLTFASSAAFAQAPARTDDPNGAAMARQGDQTPAANAQKGKIQKETDPKKNGTSQSEDLNGGKKNGQPQ